MKISTGLFFDRATQHIGAGQQRLSEAQVQLASGKKINNASDEPDKASALQRVRTLIEQQESYSRNVGVVTERLQAQDVALEGVSSLLQRLRELSIQYSNGTLGADQRRIAAIEVRGIRDQIHALANTLDSTGRAVFGGSRVDEAPFAEDGRYQGDQTANRVPVGSSRQVSNRRAGDDVFISVIRTPEGPNPEVVGFFGVIDDLADALERNELDDARRAIDEVAVIHQGVSLAQANIGSDLNIAEAQQDTLREQTLQMKSLESDMQDVDYAEAVSQMQKQMMALEAAQSSFARISRLSLFEYI